MAVPRKSRVIIYKSRRHILATLFFILIPFVFLLLFSRIAKITASQLFANVFVSVIRMIVAYVIAIILAWTLAVLFYRGKRASVALPIFDVGNSFPTSAILPLAAFYLGSSDFTVILALVLTIIWPLLFSIISSLKLIRRDWEEVAEVTRLSGFRYLKNFLIPVSIPGLVTGSIIGLGDGWEAIAATEIIIGIKSGVGNFFQLSAHSTQTTLLGILALLLIIFSINKLIWLPLLERSHRMMGE